MDILTSINNKEINLIAFIFILLLLILAVIFIIRLELRIKKLMRGKSGSSLEDSFNDIQKDVQEMKRFRTDLEKYLKLVEKRVSKSIQGVHNFNFNAFKGNDSGGKSFASAFINEKGDGLIISSLHARDRVSVFSKQIKGFKSEIELTEEEATALTKAKEYCNL